MVGSKSNREALARRTSETDKRVGARMKLFRLSAGLSQSQIGERLGVSFQQVQKYEKGANRIGAGTLFLIAEILTVPVFRFFETDENDPATLYRSIRTADEAFDFARMLADVRRIKVRRRLRALIEAIAQTDGDQDPKRRTTSP